MKIMKILLFLVLFLVPFSFTVKLKEKRQVISNVDHTQLYTFTLKASSGSFLFQMYTSNKKYRFTIRDCSPLFCQESFTFSNSEKSTGSHFILQRSSFSNSSFNIYCLRPAINLNYLIVPNVINPGSVIKVIYYPNACTPELSWTIMSRRGKPIPDGPSDYYFTLIGKGLNKMKENVQIGFGLNNYWVPGTGGSILKNVNTNANDFDNLMYFEIKGKADSFQFGQDTSLQEYTIENSTNEFNNIYDYEFCYSTSACFVQFSIQLHLKEGSELLIFNNKQYVSNLATMTEFRGILEPAEYNIISDTYNAMINFNLNEDFDYMQRRLRIKKLISSATYLEWVTTPFNMRSGCTIQPCPKDMSWVKELNCCKYRSMAFIELAGPGQSPNYKIQGNTCGYVKSDSNYLFVDDSARLNFGTISTMPDLNNFQIYYKAIEFGN